MRNGAPAYRFGPFELDPRHRRLQRDGQPIRLHGRQMDVLLILASHPGQLVSKDALVAGAWRDTAVSDSAIFQAVRRLRHALGLQADGAPYIETLVGEGYRFAATPEPRAPSASLVVDPLLAPYRDFVDGRTGLERLDRDAVARARRAFADGLRQVPDDALAHIGLANACVLHFESTRADVEPDTEALLEAHRHAREGCQLDPLSGDAWSTLGFVRHRLGDARDAQAAARKAVSLDSSNWHHQARLALVSWGEARLRAARRAQALCPGLALAHWLAASVFVARQTFDLARIDLRAGCALLDAQDAGTSRFRAVGLHLLHGLVCAATGNLDSAREELQREIESSSDDHVYGRECRANARYATGALHLHAGRRAEAAYAFRHALDDVPGHALASVGLAAIETPSHIAVPRAYANRVDAAIVQAAALVLNGQHHDAAHLCRESLMHAESDMHGWLLPVDPLLNVSAHADEWQPVLALLRNRAS